MIFCGICSRHRQAVRNEMQYAKPLSLKALFWLMPNIFLHYFAHELSTYTNDGVKTDMISV